MEAGSLFFCPFLKARLQADPLTLFDFPYLAFFLGLLFLPSPFFKRSVFFDTPSVPIKGNDFPPFPKFLHILIVSGHIFCCCPLLSVTLLSLMSSTCLASCAWKWSRSWLVFLFSELSCSFSLCAFSIIYALPFRELTRQIRVCPPFLFSMASRLVPFRSRGFSRAFQISFSIL